MACRRTLTVSICLVWALSVFSDASTPENIHLTYGDTYDDVNVMWSSTASDDVVGAVTYGESVFSQNNHVGSDRVAQQSSETAYYRAKLKDISSKNIVYTVKSGDDSAEKRYFRIPDPKENSELSFLVSRGTLTSQSPIIAKLKEQAESFKYAGLLWLGNGENATSSLSALSAVASYVPCLPAPGRGDEETGRYSQYRSAFATPGVPTWPLPIERLWYSFNIGPVHFISINTEVFDDNENDLKTAQHNWLLDDLKEANTKRGEQSWIVAFGYQALYCSVGDDDCSVETTIVRRGLEDILFQGGVDLVISSNGKGYERTYPVYKEFVHSINYTGPTAPVHLVLSVGVGNASLNTSDWVAVAGNETFTESYGKLSVSNGSILVWELISAKTGDILDTFTINQTYHDEFVTISPDEHVSEVTKVSVTTTTPIPTTTVKNDATNPEEVTVDNSTKNSTEGEQSKFGIFWHKVTKALRENRALSIGVGSGIGFMMFLICSACLIRYRRRNRVNVRRWDRLDCNTKYYRDIKTADDDYDSYDETEINIDGTKPTSKLLKADGRNSVL